MYAFKLVLFIFVLSALSAHIKLANFADREHHSFALMMHKHTLVQKQEVMCDAALCVTFSCKVLHI